MPYRPPLLLALCVPVFALLPAMAQGADTKAACADAYGKAQSLRDAQKLLSAREQLRICARSTCTKFIARDCTTWLDEIEQRVPSVVLFARDASGTDLTNATVAMDGSLIAHQLDGHAVELDAGRHSFVFTLPDGKTLEQTYVVLEGQKAQRVGVTLPSVVVAKGPSGNDAAPPGEGSGGSSWGALKIAGLAAGIAGLGGLGVGSYFGIAALNASNAQKNECSSSSSCNADKAATDHSAASNDSVIANIAFAAGGALLVTGVVLFIVSPKNAEQGPQPSTASLQVLPAVGPSGGSLWLRGTF